MASKRVSFFIGHLSCSIIMAIFIIAVIFFVWFPAPLAYAEGVTTIFLMVLIIDVILGPLLTFIVYKEGKKSLKMDLSIIIIIQLLALGYGVYNIAQSRPVWIVQNGPIFQLVRANGINEKFQTDANPNYQVNGWLQPKWVAVDADNPRYENFLEPTYIPDLYTNLEKSKERIKQNAIPLDALNAFNDQNDVEDVLRKYPSANAWMPLRTTELGCVVLVNSTKGEVVKVVNLRPWK